MLLNAILSLFLLNPSDTTAQDTVVVVDRALEEVVVTTSRAGRYAPVTKSTIKMADMPLNYNGQEMPAVLSQTPSVTWYSDGGHYTGYAYYRIRGIDQTRINATLNGIPLNEPEDQGAYFSNFPDFVSSLKSVQVQRGVGIGNSGTASYGGAINLESQPLLDSAYLQSQITLGSFNTLRYNASFNSGLMNKFAMYARVSTVTTDGFRDHSGTNGVSTFVSAGYFGKKSMLKFTGFAGMSDNEMAYLAASKPALQLNYKANPLREDENDEFLQSLLSLDYTLNINEDEYLTASVYYNRLVGNYDVLMQPDMNNFQLNSHFIGSFLNYNIDTDDGVHVTAGIHANTYSRTHRLAIKPETKDYIYSNTGNKRELSIFLRASSEMDQFVLSMDVQQRYVDFVYSPDPDYPMTISNRNYWTLINPKGGLTYRFDNENNIYFSAGMVHREPTRNDMFGGYDNLDQAAINDIVHLDSVKVETVSDFELGTNIHKGPLSLNFNLYYMKFKDEIAAIGKLSYIGLPLRKNVDDSYRTGIELDATVQASKRLQLKTSLTLSKNRIKEYTTEYDGMTYYNVNPLLTPSFVMNQFIVYDYRKFTFNLNGRYVSSSFLDNTNNKDFTVPSSLIINTTISYRPNKSLKFSFDTNNILNQQYYYSGYVQDNVSHYFAMATRNYFLTITACL